MTAQRLITSGLAERFIKALGESAAYESADPLQVNLLRPTKIFSTTNCAFEYSRGHH